MSLRAYGWLTSLTLVGGVVLAVAGVMVKMFIFTLMGLALLSLAFIFLVLSLFALSRHLKLMTDEGSARFASMLAEEEKKFKEKKENRGEN